ncbi:ATP-binding protein [Fulvivirga lutea]|uniref:histidine kinase n=1 Tax=Fulvivirga lutea TaxID=2810512 RepID=A0A974WJF1_9BACT|nr:tetratricopeptide repeat-containing sensor histidine kinase [Fulvivirga lutea]QSE97265.1 tetratricopeptide repeat protein [Fulvivirga lutea]
MTNKIAIFELEMAYYKMLRFVKKYIFWLFFLFPFLGVSQNVERIDSLNAKLSKLAINDSNRIELYNQLGWEYRKSEPDSTILYAERAIALTKRLNSDRGIAKPLNYIGIGYHYKGDNVKSFEYYNKALEEAEIHNDSSQYAHALNSLGRLHLNQGDFLKSYDTYFKALKIFEAIDDWDGVSYCYKSLAELYQTQNNYEKALEMSEKSFQIRIESGNIRGQISILIEIAGIYEQIENFDKAFDHYLQAKVKAESIDDKINIANIDLGISKLYYSEAKYDEALIFGLKAFRAVSSTRNMDLRGQIELQLGKVYFEQREYERSKDFLEKVIEDSDKTQDLSLQRDAYYYLSEIAANQNDVTASYNAFLKYTELNHALDNAEVARTIERLEARFEIEKKNQENEVLKAQQARDEAIIERQQIQNIALTVIIFVVSSLLVFIWVMSRKRRADNLKLREKNEEIAAQREEISRQNDQINTQNEKLQKRNADLAQLNQEKDTLMNIVAHDLKSPFNRIKGITELLKLSGLNEEQKNYNELLKDISQSGIDLIRDLLDVNSFEDDSRKMDITKVDACDMLLTKAKYFYADAKSKNIEIVTDIKDAHAYLHTDETYLSRILDNLISNAIKFSNRDSKVVLGAARKENNVLVFIQDSGPGFNEEDKKNLYKKFTKLSAQPTAGESSNGLGLAIVKTLVDRLNGEIKLETGGGGGSKFTLTFPVGVEAKSSSRIEV